MRNTTLRVVLIIVGITFCLGIALATDAAHAQNAADADLTAVWQRVQQSGAYRFSADIVQTTRPGASVANAGRRSHENRLYLEGTTDVDGERLALTLWSGGGSVLDPDAAVEIRIDGSQAQARRVGGEWQEIEDFTGLFAPGGDFLAYTQAATNVVRHAPETRATALGDVVVTRYGFEIDGQYFARSLREQLTGQAVAEGLPAGVRVELPPGYSTMTGRGELWVGEDGLPLRQTFSLDFPADAYGDKSSAIATVDFFDFADAGATAVAWPGGARSFTSLFNPNGVVATVALRLFAATLGLFVLALVVVKRRSRFIYGVVASGVSLSMVAVPLLTNQRIYAYSVAQEASRQQQAQQQSMPSVSDALDAREIDPHTDPLAAAETVVAYQESAVGDDDSGAYFSALCVNEPYGDADGDTIVNISECVLGTLPDVADTDQDGLNDNIEVAGGKVSGSDKIWYTNPLLQDTNNDGLADGKEWYVGGAGATLPDTDGNGTPDVWDDDNDGDGVRDNLDLSPYLSTKPDVAKEAKTFTADDPLSLNMEDLEDGKLVKVEFQLAPTAEDHLRYTQNILDWPDNDRQGQLQDADGKTFYEIDNTVAPNPNDNGDVRMVPMLEIEISGSTASLPPAGTCTDKDGNVYDCFPILNDFGISVQEVVTGTTWVAYVPLQLVTDSVGDDNVAFYGRMYYQLDSGWGDVQKVRMVWVVQMLNDICAAYENNICATYSSYNQLQVIQTYGDEWYLTGMNVTEEHGADIALIYEDPAVIASVPGAPAGYDKPFYMDTLYGLLYGLDSTFLAGADCQPGYTGPDDAGGTDTCTPDGKRDVTVDAIYTRFNHATNSGISAQKRWNLPNVLTVEKNAYDSLDLGMLETTTNTTKQLLDGHFTSHWSASDPITPTIMLAHEQSYRGLNMDEAQSGDGNLGWSGNGLTIKLPTSGDSAVSLDTMASLKWTPYSYSVDGGWVAAAMDSYYDDLSEQLGTAFSSITDPGQAGTQQTMAQLLYVTVYGGDSNVVQIDNQIVTYNGAQPDVPIGISLTAQAGKYLATAVDKYFTFTSDLEDIAESFPQGADFEVLALEYIQQKIFGQFAGTFGAAKLVGLSLVLIVVLTDLVVSYVLHDANTPFGEGLDITVHIFFLIKQAYDIGSDVKTTIELAQALSEVDDGLSFSNALLDVLSSDSALIDVSRVFGVVGLIISAAVAIGVFLYAVASGKADSGAALGDAFAATIAAIVVAVTLFVLSLTVVGAIVVAIVLLVDAILKLAGVKWTITGEITSTLTSIIFHEDLIESFTVDTGNLSLALGNPAQGIIATNPITYSFPITTEFTKIHNGTDCEKDPTCYIRNQMIYMLSDKGEDDWTIWENGINPTVWHNHYNTNWFSYVSVAYQQSSPAGVNVPIPLTLSNYYDALVENCWWFIIESCAVRDVPGTTATDLGDAVVLDVLPATLEEFVDVAGWSSGYLALIARDADGDGLRAVAYGGPDLKDHLWDQDGDRLSDGYELIAASRSADQGGVDLDLASRDTDGDSVLSDNVEVRWGINPGRLDTDGDGLPDVEELPLSGGWSIAYAYDPSTGTTTDARVWSDPNRADADGDGMSDLFEQDQNTLTQSPWADPNNPRIYNPSVWNESPVALYVSDDSVQGYVRPGATVVYTTSTTNNLSNGQDLVGELSLTLPDGVSGSPISTTVNIQSGESDAVVSSLTFNGTSSQAYQLSSAMSLTDFDQTRWRWEETVGTSRNGMNGSPQGIAVAPTSGWSGAYVVATRERNPGLGDDITTYQIRSDGTEISAKLQYLPNPNGAITDPAVACNFSGACIVLWGVNPNDQTSYRVTGFRLENGLENPSTMYVSADSTVRNVSIVSDGSDFMVAWAEGNGVVKVAKIPATGGIQAPKQVATVSGSDAATAIAWTGKNYVIVWTGDGNIHQAAVSVDGDAGGATVLGAGSGWPQRDGSVHPPVLAYDDVSGQTLVAYRSPTGALAARRIVGGAGDEFVLTDEDVSGDNVKVALSADPKNSGWAVAWTPAAGGEVEYRAISPLGELRGDIGLIDDSTVTALALICQTPRPQLLMAFREEQGDKTFADSSGNDRTVTCSGACPEAGVTGRTGNAALFNGVNASLAVAKGMALNSFTVAAWLKRGDTGRAQSFASTAGPILRFGFDTSDKLYCNFGPSGNADLNQVESTQVYVDDLWHHYACTFDTNAKRMTLYRDGVAVATGTTADTFSGDNTFFIGRGSTADDSGYFNGEMEDFLVVNRAMTAAELSDVFQDAVAVFDMDEPKNANRFINAVPGGLDGSCSDDACPTMGVEGVAFTAAQFDGRQSIEIVGSESNATKTYSWDFEDNTTTDWSYSTGGAPPIKAADRNGETTNFVSFEPDSSRELELTLTNLPAHDSIIIAYDLYVLGSSWRGSRTDLTGAYSDYSVRADGTIVMVTDFSNATSNVIGEYQLYPAVGATIDEAFPSKGISYFEDGTSRYSGCSGESGGSIADIPSLNQDFQLNDKVSCVEISTDTVARLFRNTNYGGTSWLIDPGRSQRPDYADNGVSSMRVWPAAFYPKHGSTNESLTVGSISNADTAIYRVVQTISHSQSSLKVAFKGAHELGLDNVTVTTAESGTNIPLKNSSFTLSAWAKADSSGGGYLISQGPGETNQGLRFGVSANGTAYCNFWGNDLETTITPDAAWHHWVCTYDATDRKRTLYRDGVQIAQDTASSNYIGEGPTYLGAGFVGTIDEVGIWTIPLTAAQVQDLYQKVKIEDESVLVCQLPQTHSNGKVNFGVLTLRETTTRLGDVNQTLNRTITVDADAPSASIASGYFSPSAPGPYVSSAGALVIAGSASDPTSFVSEVRIAPSGGTMTPAAGTESWSFTWETATLSDGPQPVVIEATDAVGNSSSPATWHTILDTTPPDAAFGLANTTIRPTRNSAGRWLVPLKGSVSEPAAGGQPGSGVSVVEILLQGQNDLIGLGWQAATLSGDTWEIDYVMPVFGANGQRVPDPTGVYTATVRATDNVSNTTPVSGYPVVEILVNGDGPQVAPSTALSNTTVISRAIEIGGQVIAGDTVQSVEVSLVPGAQMGALNGNVLSLPMDENLASQYFDDQSGSNHDATCNAGACPTVGEQGRRDLAFRFNGDGDYLDAGANVVDLSNNDFTISAWVKTTGVEMGIATKNNADTQWQTGEKSFYLNNFGVPDFVGWGDNYIRGTTAVNDGDWHHVVVTWQYSGSGTAGIGKIYVDGVDDTAGNTNYAVAHLDNIGDTFKIGRPNFGTEAFKYFDGWMDEVVVYQRALADYEVANLYSYGLGSWVDATLEGDVWRYQIPGGDSGIEGLFQLNVRGTDAAGNVTPQGGQRVWRGEIDTKAPTITAPVTVTTSGGQVTTIFDCHATDFSLDDGTSCTSDWAPPYWRASDRSFADYGSVNLWYGATFTETQRLYAIDATRVYTGTPVPNVNVTACDSYGHCTTVPSDVHREDAESLTAMPISPLPGNVVTSLDPISVTGHALAPEGAAALVVEIDGSMQYLQTWLTDTPVDEEWSFPWTPPGAGIYTIQPILYDWSDYVATLAANALAAEAARQPATPASGETGAELPVALYFPLISGQGGRFGTDAGDGLHRSYLPMVATVIDRADGMAGPRSLIYVDLEAPSLTIDPVVLTATHARGRNGVLLSGAVADDTKVVMVEVSIDGSAWQQVNGTVDKRWQHLWVPESVLNGETVALSLRATDVAGRTTTVSEQLYADTLAPKGGEVGLFYIDRDGVSVTVNPPTINVATAEIGLEWGAAEDGTAVEYRVGFSQSLSIDEEALTSYASAGRATQVVAAGERWYAIIQYVDQVGNKTESILGPLFIVPRADGAR